MSYFGNFRHRDNNRQPVPHVFPGDEGSGIIVGVCILAAFVLVVFAFLGYGVL